MDKKKVLSQKVKKEIKSLYKKQEKIILDKEIDAVWILSGPGNFFRPLDDEKKYMQWMDRHRIIYGFLLAREVAALRCKKFTKDLTDEDLNDKGPLIIYNGVANENAALKKAIEKSLIIYSDKKVIIIDKVLEGERKRNIIHTKDQILSFPVELIKKEALKRIAIVSHIQHFPRIMRYHKKYKIFPDTLRLEVYGLKPPKEKSKEFTKEEVEKVWKYYQKGDLSWWPLKV